MWLKADGVVLVDGLVGACLHRWRDVVDRHVGGVLGLIERDPHVRLGRQVVDLVGSHLLEHAPQPRSVGQVSVDQLKSGLVMRVLIQMIDPAGMKR